MGARGYARLVEAVMARFMERFEQHMRDDPALRVEYERLGPRFRAIGAAIAVQRRVDYPGSQ